VVALAGETDDRMIKPEPQKQKLGTGRIVLLDRSLQGASETLQERGTENVLGIGSQ
jgi:hypothetical protein